MKKLRKLGDGVLNPASCNAELKPPLSVWFIPSALPSHTSQHYSIDYFTQYNSQ